MMDVRSASGWSSCTPNPVPGSPPFVPQITVFVIDTMSHTLTLVMTAIF
jgi:hypothetical protein